MIFEKVEDMELWPRAKEFWRRVDDLLRRPPFQNDRDISSQLRRAADSIVSNIEEGFEQSTDKMFAQYLYVSKGSNAEAIGRLKRAREKNYISAAELRSFSEISSEIGRMTVGMIKHLAKSNRKNRRIGRKEEPRVPPPEPPVDAPPTND